MHTCPPPHMTLSVHGGIYYFSRRNSRNGHRGNPADSVRVALMNDHDLFFTFLGCLILFILAGVLLLGAT